MTDAGLFFTIFGLVLWVILVRLIGAWMLRITDLIENQQTLIKLQKNQMSLQQTMIDVLVNIKDNLSQPK